jgi:predicted  nucleic acid-binding Zn-ribbon protein
MKKAFDQNVSRAKPRIRLGAAFSGLAPPEELAPEPTHPVPEPARPDLAAEVRARAAAAAEPRPTAVEALQRALEPARAAAAPPAEVVEIQTPSLPEPEPAPRSEPAPGLEERRGRLKERLKAVRENPRPEPLPATVAQAGAMAVERIAALQGELGKLRQHNLSLAQELEATRRQSEKATEEARLRMDEARRLSVEMESRAQLLGELEKELESLEAERDETLLRLQESRQAMDEAHRGADVLRAEIQKRDQQLQESLAEEERIASELEAAKDESATLRRAVQAVTEERDALVKQVSQLSAEVAELLQARRALEQVHRALSQAALR